MSVWFITGVSSGFGLELALAALKKNKVIGTVRSRERAADAVKRIEGAGGVVLEMDVTKEILFEHALKIHERIDVLCNNAGMAYLGAAEAYTDREVQDQMAVNLYGPIRLMQAALPHVKTIVNISSIAGIDGLPGCAIYTASKFAVEGFSESLAKEGVDVLIVEPGAFRTNFLGAYKVNESKMNPAVQETLDKFKQFDGKQPGDPAKGAVLIVDVVSGTGAAGRLKGKVLRLPLGADCVGRLDAKVKKLKEDIDLTREFAVTTGFDM